MDFNERKLPLDAERTLLRCPIESVHAYVSMIAPVYLELRLNARFVSIKAPLDFFTPEELARLSARGEFRLPKFIETAVPFSDAGRKVRALLAWDPAATPLDSERALGPTPYELSDALLRLVAPLWGANGEVPELGIEPFFTVAFANELCATLPPEALLRARESDLESYERAILASSWVTLAAIMLGYADRVFLDRLRERVFRRMALGEVAPVRLSDVDQLENLAYAVFGGDAVPRRVTLAQIEGRPERAAQKLVARLRRVNRELNEPRGELPTIYGPRGFADG
jgi:hypothetical protein